MNANVRASRYIGGLLSVNRNIEHASFDAVFVFDAIHDQADPSGVLDRVYEALVPGGVFLIHVHSRFRWP